MVWNFTRLQIFLLTLLNLLYSFVCAEIPNLLHIIGFTPQGIRRDSLAADLERTFFPHGIPHGSWFAILQRIGSKGWGARVEMSIHVTAIVGGVLATGLGGDLAIRKFGRYIVWRNGRLRFARRAVAGRREDEERQPLNLQSEPVD